MADWSILGDLPGTFMGAYDAADKRRRAAAQDEQFGRIADNLERGDAQPAAGGWGAAALAPGGAGGSAPAIPGEALDKGKFVYDGLVKRGVPQIVALGMAGNAYGESNFDSNAAGDKGTSFGLIQARGPRFTQLQAIAAQKGTHWSDPETQLDHIAFELNGPEANAARIAAQAKTPEEAALLLAQHYERPAAWALQQSGPKRAGFAKQLAGYVGQGGEGTMAGLGLAGSGTPAQAPLPPRRPDDLGADGEDGADDEAPAATGATAAAPTPRPAPAASVAQPVPPAALPALTAAPSAGTQQQRQLIGMMLRDPSTRAAGLQALLALGNKESGWDIKTVGDQAYLFNGKGATPVMVPLPTQAKPTIQTVGDKQYWLRPGEKPSEANLVGASKDAKPTVLAPGSTVYDEDTQTGVYTAPTKPVRDARDPEVLANTREGLADKYGLEPGSAERKRFVLTGQLADQSRIGNMNPTEEKLFNAQNGKVEHLENALGALRDAAALNDKISEGWAADILPKLGRVPLVGNLVDQDKAAATTTYQNLAKTMQMEAAKQMFPGRVTNYDEQLMQSISPDAGKTAKERASVLQKMQAKYEKMLADETATREAMKAGTFFQKQPASGPNLRGPGPNTSLPIKIPANMKPEDVQRRFPSGTPIVLPDGTPGVVP